MSVCEGLSSAQQELVALGAALGSNWVPCIEYHIPEARKREDPAGSDTWTPNSELRALVGYRRQLWPESRVGFQYYIEWIQDYDTYLANLPAGAFRRDEVRHVAMVRFTQLLAYQTWQLGFFVFVGLTEADYLAIPEIRRRITDELWGAVGANLFGGGPPDLFGALAANDNIYLAVRYGF